MQVNSVPTTLQDLPRVLLAALKEKNEATVSFNRKNPNDIDALGALGTTPGAFESTIKALLEPEVVSSREPLKGGIALSAENKGDRIVITFVLE
jgi:hypothetical protein